MWLYYLLVLFIGLVLSLYGNSGSGATTIAATIGLPKEPMLLGIDIPVLNLIFLAFMVGVYYSRIRKMENNIERLCNAVTRLHDEHISCPHCNHGGRITEISNTNIIPEDI